MDHICQNIEELSNQIATKITRLTNKPLCISKRNLKYAYGQLKLSQETCKHCNFSITGENSNGYYRFKKGFYGLPDIPTVFQEKMGKT